MIVNLSQLKAWFSKGCYPIESQFHSWIDSFWHKTDDKIPMVAIDGLTGRLNELNDRHIEYTVFQFAKSTSLTPPLEWNPIPPSISSVEYLWFRSGIVINPSTEPSTWSIPCRITGTKGNTGIPGRSGEYTVFNFNRRSTKYDLGGPGNAPGWSSVPPDPNVYGKYLYMVCGIVTPPDMEPLVWGPVSCITGDDGLPGQGVPSGGTTGQVLVKRSNSNYDCVWMTK